MIPGDMRRLALAALLLALGGVLAGPASSSGLAPQLTCKYGFKYVTKVVHGHKKRVKVCKKKPKPKPPPAKPKADLQLTMSSTLDQATAGNHVVYTVLAENKGPQIADATTITMDLPPGKAELYGYGGSGEPSDCTVTASATGNHLECKFGQLDVESDELFGASAYAYVTVQLEPSQPGDYTVTGQVTSSTTLDPSPQDARTTAPLRVLPGPPAADLSIVLESPPQAQSIPGGYDQTISVTNHGPSEATDVLVTALLPQGASATPPGLAFVQPTDLLTLISSQCLPFAYGFYSSALACFTSVGSGETKTATLHVEPSIHSPAQLRTDAVVTSYTRDSNLANNRASAEATVSPFTPAAGVDLRLSFDQPTGLEAGKPFYLPFHFANLGLEGADDITVDATVSPSVETLGLGLNVGSEGTGCASTSDSSSCTIGELESDARGTGAIFGQSIAAGTYSATVTITSPDLSAPVRATQTFVVK
jgi:uncharacterized repeat protein (TIGR01451 family)